MRDEQVISEEIRARYARDPRIPHPTEVAVSARNGTVTLRGKVGSPRQVHAAVEIANSVRGVRTVYDELSVDPRDMWEDNEIRGAALQALMSTADVPDDQIDVYVNAGWLTLRGQVKHQYDSNAAFEVVSALPGVRGITNEIKVVTAGGH
jgi:osmotically-inducible protein OsmY